MRKSQLEDLVHSMPEEIDLEELMDRLYLIGKLEKAEAEVAAGQLVPHEDVVHLTDDWFK